MYRNQLFAIGITVKYGYGGSDQYGWWAGAQFEDFGHCARGSVQGLLETKYIDDLQTAIDTIKADVEQLGVKFVGSVPDSINERFQKPHLYYIHDGESEEYPPPNGWRKLLREEAKRIGFFCIY